MTLTFHKKVHSWIYTPVYKLKLKMDLYINYIYFKRYLEINNLIIVRVKYNIVVKVPIIYFYTSI